MAYKNKSKRNAAALARYYQRKNEAVQLLGGECNKCGSTEQLEFDHVHPEEKSFTISKLWSVNRTDFLKEVRKCQLLCEECHQAKTTAAYGPRSHGTHAMHRRGGCRCDKCRAFFNAYRRELRERKRLKTQ